MSSSVSKRPVIVVSCQVLQDLLVGMLPDGLASEVVFMDYGLHRVPGKMTGALQEVLDQIEEPSLVVLGGNGLNGLRAGKHTLLVPRVDDCIALLLGSRKAYIREFEAVPGTYYLSKGWLESGSHPLKEYEEYVPKYGPEQAMWIMDQQYQHYERLVLVAHSYEEILGSDRYVRRLVEVAAAPDTAQAGGEFLVIPPGGQIGQEQFIR
jgi:hypothetical protein